MSTDFTARAREIVRLLHTEHMDETSSISESGEALIAAFAVEVAREYQHAINRLEERTRELRTELDSCCEREQARWQREQELTAERDALQRKIEDATCIAQDLHKGYMALQRTVAKLRALIADDHYAMSFQTLGQYRTALLRALAAPGEGK